MQQNKVVESIWADGVPKNIKDEDRLTLKHILSMCIRFTVDEIIKDRGYKVLGINDETNSYPNILLEKDEKKYAVAVVPCIYPNFIRKNDELRIRFAKDAEQRNLIPVLCPVLIHSQDVERAKASVMLKGDLFRIGNLGQKILTTEETQEITPQTLDFKL